MGQRKIKLVNGNMVDYELYDLVDKSDDVLKKPCAPFDFSNPPVDPKFLSVSLAETMIKKGGIGLAANQVGIPYRVFSMALVSGVTDTTKVETITLFNPVVLGVSKHNLEENEGCLTYPNLYLKVPRPAWVKVQYQMFNGQSVTGQFQYVDARCILHEIEHLDGIVFTTKVGSVKLQMAEQRAKKLQRNQSSREASLSY